ncbi:TPA: hypothetical protein ACFP4U_001639 [Neisseria lactamica]|uniref:Uncharacterized protein n=1 Tax=Neisseria lactamica TaxID=486 RepID=A0AAU8VSQ7_NEILA|nr:MULTISPECIES: hypothetical protein [Neisseria]ARB04359.1 hypothetical protein B2G52_05200 [Neisseria lactamica]CBX22402.1 unnamed protein product [Neisseria lactamica Y92-1009]
MWKIIKEDSDDLGFAIKCLFSQSIDLNEFKLWIEQVIRDMPIEDIPFYIFDLADLDEEIDNIYNIIGFVSSYSLSKLRRNALTGIAFLRGIDVYDPPVSKEKALKALEKHPEIYHKFKRFFPFVELPLL